MSRMRNLDDVTAVHLAKSARGEESDTERRPAVSANPDERAQDIQDCVGSKRVTKFEMLIEFGGAAAAGRSRAAGGVTRVPRHRSRPPGRRAAGRRRPPLAAGGTREHEPA